MSERQYVIRARGDGRFIIADPATGQALDDANGHGYTSREKAARAAWYKFKGGKAKLDVAKGEADRFWRANKAFAKKLGDMAEYNV
jgi:hypothetical protein